MRPLGDIEAVPAAAPRREPGAWLLLDASGRSERVVHNTLERRSIRQPLELLLEALGVVADGRLRAGAVESSADAIDVHRRHPLVVRVQVRVAMQRRLRDGLGLLRRKSGSLLGRRRRPALQRRLGLVGPPILRRSRPRMQNPLADWGPRPGGWAGGLGSLGRGRGPFGTGCHNFVVDVLRPSVHHRSAHHSNRTNPTCRNSNPFCAGLMDAAADRPWRRWRSWFWADPSQQVMYIYVYHCQPGWRPRGL